MRSINYGPKQGYEALRNGTEAEKQDAINYFESIRRGLSEYMVRLVQVEIERTDLYWQLEHQKEKTAEKHYYWQNALNAYFGAARNLKPRPRNEPWDGRTMLGRPL
jgi:hypothetical protein